MTSCRWRAAMRWKLDLAEHRLLERSIRYYQREVLEHGDNPLVRELGLHVLGAHLPIYRRIDDRIRAKRLRQLRRRFARRT